MRLLRKDDDMDLPMRYHLAKSWLRYHVRGLIAEREIRPGDFYEDCRYHPMVCVDNYRGDDLRGVSLITGMGPSSCSMFHCGVVKMTEKEALERKRNWKEFSASLAAEYPNHGYGVDPIGVAKP